MADYYNKGKYALAETSFNDFLNAYESVYMDEKIGSIGMREPFIENIMKSIIIAKPRLYDYIFNLEWFKIQLKDYLESKYSLDFIAYMIDEGIDYDRHFGIGCYDFIVCYLDDILKNQQFIRLDYRIFTLICDYRSLFKMRIDYFMNKKICIFSSQEIETYEMLCDLSNCALNLSI